MPRSRPRFVFLPLFLLVSLAARLPAVPQEPEEELRPLHEEGKPYRTPRAGEGFRTTVLGEDVRVPPRDRRSVSAWDIGAEVVPGAEDEEILPFGSLYFWRHPDEDLLFRGIVTGVFNEILYAESPEGAGPIEWITTFENFTVPVDRSELIDGESFTEEELLWGYVRGGLGVGWREQIAPWAQDNMVALSFRVEPGFLYFDEGSDAAPGFVAPEDTFELRLHLRLRHDQLERNLLELPHRGIATGADLSWGARSDWDDWGVGRSRDATDERDFVLFSAYAVGATGLPFSKSERHRLLGYIHGGIASDSDRFSAERVGGGPQGEEVHALARPVLPGASINEFFPNRYLVGVAEYRFEPIFFTYLSVRSSIGYLNRNRRLGGGIRREDDVLASIGTRLTTGLPGELRLQVDYNYNFGVIRDGDFGGHEVMAHISRQF